MIKTYATIALLMSSLLAFSQDSGDIEFGFVGGINLSNESTVDDAQNPESRIGFNAGFYGDYFFSESWSLKLKLSYDQRGWKNGLLFDGTPRRVTYSLHYLSIPLKPNWHFGKNKNFYLNLGPYVAILLGANAGTTQVRDFFNKTDFGLEGDIGVKFPISSNEKTKLFFEFSGLSGFTDLFEFNGGNAVRNTRLSLNTGITF